MRPLALTMGEPAGIGGEIAMMAWTRRGEDLPPFFLLDDPDRLTALSRRVGLNVPLARIETPEAAGERFADALPVLERPEIRALFERQGVLTPVELASRYEVYTEQYILAIEVEARLALRIARTQIHPAVMTFLESQARSLRDQEALGLPTDRSLVSQVAGLNQQLLQQCGALEAAIQNPPHDGHGHLHHCAGTLMTLMGQLRESVDVLETLVDDNLWPLPTYGELLFVR